MQSLRPTFVYMRRLATGWILSYVAVCLLLGGTESAKPIWHMAAILWPIVLVCVTWKLEAYTGHASVVRITELCFTNLAFVVLFAELVLRAYSSIHGQSLILNHTLQAHMLKPGHDYGHGLRGNSLGFPGPDWAPDKPHQTYRIAVMGDSFLVGPAVSYSDNFVSLIEQGLMACEVLNFGVSGAGPHEYLAIYDKDVRQFDPDLVLVCIFVGNDITERLATPRNLSREQHSLYLFCRYIVRNVFQQRTNRPATGNDRLIGYALSPETFREVEARRLEVCVRPVSEKMERRWARALGPLKNLISACRDDGRQMAVVLIPDEFQVNPTVLAMALADRGLKHDNIDLTYPQRRLRAFFSDNNVPCLDLLQAFATVTNTYAPYDTHWNVHGNHLAAATIRHWLKDELFGDRFQNDANSGR